jgi:hypothetical protein
VLKKVVDEVDSIFEGEEPNVETVEMTPYLDKVLKEVLRYSFVYLQTKLLKRTSDPS